MTWEQEVEAQFCAKYGPDGLAMVRAAMVVGEGVQSEVLEMLAVFCTWADEGRAVDDPRAWLAAMRRNAKYSSWLARARRGVRDGVYARRRGREGPSVPDTESEDSEASSWLRLALSRLPDEIKFAIEVRFRLGLTLQETADRLGLGSPAAASRLIERGLAMLRREANRLAASAGA